MCFTNAGHTDVKRSYDVYEISKSRLCCGLKCIFVLYYLKVFKIILRKRLKLYFKYECIVIAVL